MKKERTKGHPKRCGPKNKVMAAATWRRLMRAIEKKTRQTARRIIREES